MNRLILPLVLAIGGCATGSDIVEIQGVTRDGPGGEGLEGVTITVLDERLEQLDQGSSQVGGWYRLSIPRGEPLVHITHSGEGYRTTVFTGIPGENPRVRVPNGQSIAISDAAWADLLEKWDGCPGLGEGGTLMGRLQIADVAAENGDPLPVTTGQVRVELPDGTVRGACYLGEDGVYDADAIESGASTEFLVTSLEAGTQLVQVNWQPVQGETLTDDYTVWIPEDGIAPRYPMLVTTPFDLDI